MELNPGEQKPRRLLFADVGAFLMSLRGLLDGFCGKKGIDVHFVQIALSVGVFVEVGQRKNGFQLPADLFRKGGRELHAAVLRFQLFHLRRVLQRGERHFVDDVPLAL